jgi:hypothetical protein
VNGERAENYKMLIMELLVVVVLDALDECESEEFHYAYMHNVKFS